MSLFNEIESCVLNGYDVSFKRNIGQLHIILEAESRGEIYTDENMLPLADHFYEEKVTKCLSFMRERMHSKIWVANNNQ